LLLLDRIAMGWVASTRCGVPYPAHSNTILFGSRIAGGARAAIIKTASYNILAHAADASHVWALASSRRAATLRRTDAGDARVRFGLENPPGQHDEA